VHFIGPVAAGPHNSEDEMTLAYSDGEITGLSPAGHVLQWNADERAEYDSGETLIEYGIHNLFAHERERLALFYPELWETANNVSR
jgi:hypothetical protein